MSGISLALLTDMRRDHQSNPSGKLVYSKKVHKMSTRVSDYLAQLPRDEQEEIAASTAALIQEEATLRKVRDARNRSQEEIAQRLGVQQAAVSKLERRTDMYISTLRNLIQAMGGDLEIIARFPDQPPVRITQFNALSKG